MNFEPKKILQKNTAKSGTGHYASSRNFESSAFTLIDLAAIIAIVTVFTVLMLPALAQPANRRNAKLIQCLSNLRQIGVGCSIYASDFNGWYPITSVGSVNAFPTSVNHLAGIQYVGFFFSGSPNVPVPTTYQPNADQNLGYLFAGGIIQDGRVFFCPANSGLQPNAPFYSLSPDNYSTPKFISTDASGSTRSSYMFNPRLKNALGFAAGNNNIQRAYQKITDVKQSDILCADYLASSGVTGVPFTPDNWEHWPYKGLSTGFTDGSAKFCTFTNSTFFNAIVANLQNTESATSAEQYNQIFTALQTAP